MLFTDVCLKIRKIQCTRITILELGCKQIWRTWKLNGLEVNAQLTRWFVSFAEFSCYQRVSIASYANRWYSQRRNVRLSVCSSVTLRYCIKTKKASVMISSPSERQNILVSRNSRLITKFDRGHPERGQFLRLGWVRSTNSRFWRFFDQ